MVGKIWWHEILGAYSSCLTQMQAKVHNCKILPSTVFMSMCCDHFAYKLFLFLLLSFQERIEELTENFEDAEVNEGEFASVLPSFALAEQDEILTVWFYYGYWSTYSSERFTTYVVQLCLSSDNHYLIYLFLWRQHRDCVSLPDILWSFAISNKKRCQEFQYWIYDEALYPMLILTTHSSCRSILLVYCLCMCFNWHVKFTSNFPVHWLRTVMKQKCFVLMYCVLIWLFISSDKWVLWFYIVVTINWFHVNCWNGTIKAILIQLGKSLLWSFINYNSLSK